MRSRKIEACPPDLVCRPQVPLFTAVPPRVPPAHLTGHGTYARGPHGFDITNLIDVNFTGECAWFAFAVHERIVRGRVENRRADRTMLTGAVGQRNQVLGFFAIQASVLYVTKSPSL